MAHYVKCVYCHERFDRDKEPFVQITNRSYAHKHCANLYQTQKTQDELDYDDLVRYIQELFYLDNLSAKVAWQIKNMKETYGYTYNGIKGTLFYWYEIRKGEKDKANDGIGIVPYKYEEAKNYFAKIDRANSLNADIKNYKTTFKEITIEAPRPEVRPPKLFNLGDED
jgi:hypothetical protein